MIGPEQFSEHSPFLSYTQHHPPQSDIISFGALRTIFQGYKGNGRLRLLTDIISFILFSKVVCTREATIHLAAKVCFFVVQSLVLSGGDCHYVCKNIFLRLQLFKINKTDCQTLPTRLRYFFFVTYFRPFVIDFLGTINDVNLSRKKKNSDYFVPCATLRGFDNPRSVSACVPEAFALSTSLCSPHSHTPCSNFKGGYSTPPHVVVTIPQREVNSMHNVSVYRHEPPHPLLKKD